MEKIYLQAFIPFSFFSYHLVNYPYGNTDDFIKETSKEIVSLSKKIIFPLEEFGEQKVTFKWKNLEKLNKIYDFKPSFSKIDSKVLEISTVVKFDPNNIQISLSEELKPKINSILCYFLCDIFKKRIYDFLIITQLSKPGFVSTSKGFLFANKEYIESVEGVRSIHREMLNDIVEYEWPPIKNLDIYSVWKWININTGILNRFSTTPIERALNAFTYLFDESLTDSTTDLLWSLIGIEAIYAKGKTGIIDQVNDKTQVLLGNMSKYKKILKEMYNFRSRFVHGDLDFHAKYHINDNTNEIHKFETESSKASVISVAVLTATLQELISRDKTSLEFKYSIVD